MKDEGVAMGLEHIAPASLPPARGYSHVVRTSGATTVYVAGQVAADSDGNPVAIGDLEGQTRQALANLREALAAAGATPADVAKTTTYIVGYTPEMRAQLLAGRGDFFGEDAPAGTLIGVQALARPEFLIEIEATAVLD